MFYENEFLILEFCGNHRRKTKELVSGCSKHKPQIIKQSDYIFGVVVKENMFLM